MVHQTQDAMTADLRNKLRLHIQTFGVSDMLATVVEVLDEVIETWAIEEGKVDEAKALSAISEQLEINRTTLL